MLRDALINVWVKPWDLSEHKLDFTPVHITRKITLGIFYVYELTLHTSLSLIDMINIS